MSAASLLDQLGQASVVSDAVRSGEMPETAAGDGIHVPGRPMTQAAARAGARAALPTGTP